MKKFIISTLAMVIGVALFSATAFADTSFNTGSGVLPTVTVSNVTTNPCSYGAGIGCWSTSTTAQPGDEIAAQVSFANTGNETARNVTVSLQPSRSGTHVSFYGGAAATNAPRTTGNASVTLSQTTTITTLLGDQRPDWRTNKDSTPREVDVNALFGSGFNVGDIAPGEQGVLTVRFHVDGTPNNGGGTTPSCAINSFNPSPATIALGSSSVLTWNTSNCSYVSISTLASNLAADGSQSVSPTNTTTYRLTAYPSGATATATVTVTNNNNGCGSSCTPPSNNCSINSFYVDSNSILQGQTTTMHWNTTGASSVNISGFGNENASGSMSISPYQSTNYTLTLSGNNCSGGGSQSQSTYVTVGQQQYYYNNPNQTVSTVQTQPQAITTVAAVLGSYSAQLNGIAVPNISYGTTTAWFEYGPTTSLGNRSDSQNVNGFGSYPYSGNISGLIPGATYYYRAVVQNQNGIAYGSVVPFTTTAVTSTYTPPTRVYVQSQTVTRSAATTKTGLVAKSQPSLFKLEVDSSVDHMCVGGEINYTVNYQNISTSVLQNSILRVTLPGELTYASASQGDYDATDRTITISLGDVQPGQQGSVTVHAQVNDQAVVGKLAVITATMVYTNPVSHAQEQAIAYSLVTISNDCPSVLGASVFGFGGFLPQTLLAWLLLILVILALIVLARSLYHKKEEPAATK